MNPILTVGMIADTHIRAPDGDNSSPYPVNALANARARYAVHVLHAAAPDWTVHLGDMVHALPGQPVYAGACKEAKSILAPLAPHYVAGNHDIGDKPMNAAPAATATAKTVACYEQYFGPCRHVVTEKGCCFVSINSSLAGTDNVEESEQRRWLEKTFAAHAGRRIFLFSHYPPFINDPTEELHYDNWHAGARAWLLALLQKYRVEAVFSGHVHRFFYNRHGKTAFYCLPSTCFTRQDFSELYRGVVAPDFGRDDTGKYGVAVLRIFPRGHALAILPTFGHGLQKNESPPQIAAPSPRGGGVTATLRHAWHESLLLPANGPMEEFSRKRARDDYSLLRLLQSGIYRVRVPLADLTEPAARRRSRDAAFLGIRFVPIVTENPSPRTVSILASRMVECVEVVAPSTSADVVRMLNACAAAGKPLHLSRAHSSTRAGKDGRFVHAVSTGFVSADKRELRELMKNPAITDRVSAVVMRVDSGGQLAGAVAELMALSKEIKHNIIVHLCWGDSSPAKANFDDNDILSRLQEVMRLLHAHPCLSLQLDVYMDIDRGYTPRHGLIDRQANFRPAGQYLAGLPISPF